MPSKLKKAIGAVKDQTSISIAKVGSNGMSNLEVVILKATSHDETPLDERYVNEILQLVASNKVYAASCAQAISKRIGKTRSWIVVLKSLMLVLRIFQDGDPYFPREVLHAMKRGGKILNLSSFRDNSYSSPWDFTVYVRLFAVYLDDRLDCFLKGKLQKRVAFRQKESEQLLSKITRDMKPSILLDRMSYWQRLLDRAMVTRPTGAAKDNGLVQLSLYSVIQESFDLYRDISDGLTLLLDSFFNLQYQSCISAFQTCIRTSKQYEELSSYYAFCKSLGIGRTSEYPSVQKISDELIETMREFLKDKTSFATPPQSAFPSPSNPRSSNLTSSEPVERLSEKASEHALLCTSLEDLMVKTDNETNSSFTFYVDSFEETDRHSGREDSNSSNSSCSSPSMKATTATLPEGMNQTPDLSTIEDWLSLDQTSQHQGTYQSSEWWEFELTKTSDQPQSNSDKAFEETSLSTMSPRTNPFLKEEATSGVQSGASSNQGYDFFPAEPTFHVAPTFSVGSPNQNGEAAHAGRDLFASGFCGGLDDKYENGSSNQQKLIYEQQVWLKNQNKIIQRHRTCGS